MSFVSKITQKAKYLTLCWLVSSCSLLNGSWQKDRSKNVIAMNNSGRLETTRYLETENPDGASIVAATPYIMVDQFGYRPQDNKVAVIVDPQQGYNAADSYLPGEVIEVRKWRDSTVVYSGAPQSWNNGEIQLSSGDRFSAYSPHHGDALMFYTTLPNSYPEVKQTIIEQKIQEAQSDGEFYGFHPEKDLYRSYLPDRTYHWGSNSIRASRGSSNYDVVLYNLLPEQQTYTNAALNTLHYFHGVNPLGMTYLTNMYDYGAEKSANKIHHEWFANNTRWDNAVTSPNGPPPGYFVGGPNQDYTGKYSRLQNQPIQKMYADWNGSTLDDKSWEISEPAIYYQSAYIKLLAHFVTDISPCTMNKS